MPCLKHVKLPLNIATLGHLGMYQVAMRISHQTPAFIFQGLIPLTISTIK